MKTVILYPLPEEIYELFTAPPPPPTLYPETKKCRKSVMNFVGVAKKLHFWSETIAEDRFRRDSKIHPIDFIFSPELVHTIGMINLQAHWKRKSHLGDLASGT